MDIFSTFFSYPILKTIGWALIHSVWQILIIALLFWLITKSFQHKKPDFHYSSGLVALGLILLAFIGTIGYLFHAYQAVDEFQVASQASSVSIQTQQLENSSLYEYLRDFVIVHIEFRLPMLVNLWFIGMLFFVIRMAGNLSELRQLADKNHKALPLSIQETTLRLANSLGVKQKVKLMGSDHVQAPMAFGILKPVILLPFSLVFQMNPRQLEAILAHELAHIKRHDFAVNLLQSTLEILFFYHPAFWWINHQVRNYREHATDDRAIAIGIAPHDLAHALATVVNHTRLNAPELSMAAHGPSFPTLERIQRILGYNKTISGTHSGLISTTMILTALLSLSLLLSANIPVKLPENETWLATTLKNNSTDIPQFNRIPPNPKKNVKLILIKKDTIPKNNKSGDRETLSWLPVDFDSNIIIDIKNVVSFDSFPPFPPIPPLVLSPTPAFDFKFDEVFQDSIRIYSKQFSKEYADSIQLYTSKIIRIQRDTTPDAELLREKLKSKMEALRQQMEASQEEFAKKMEAWTKEMEPKMNEFEQKMEAWRIENEPKIKEFEAKMEKWAEKHATRMEDIEEKLKEKERELQEKYNEMKSKKDSQDIQF